jgi:hypothetical protein
MTTPLIDSATCNGYIFCHLERFSSLKEQADWVSGRAKAESFGDVEKTRKEQHVCRIVNCGRMFDRYQPALHTTMFKQ